MADTKIEAAPANLEITQPASTPAGVTFPISSEGRRQAIILLLGAISIWVFALWSVITIIEDGINPVEAVSALLMLGILMIAPAVGWTLLEEANSSFTTTPDGIAYKTLGGINLNYAWGDIEGWDPMQRGRLARFFLGEEEQPQGNLDAQEERGTNDDDAEEEEPETLALKVKRNHDRTAQIANPLARALHRLAHGRNLPVYGAIENRPGLVAAINNQLVVGGQGSGVGGRLSAED